MRFFTETELENGDMVHLTAFNADSLTELEKKLKEIWRKPEGVYEKIYCIGLHVILRVGVESYSLPIYDYCVLNPEAPFDQWQLNKWSGIFDDLNSGRLEMNEDDFFDVFGFHIPTSVNEAAWIDYLLFNPNCPERVLGKWLAEAKNYFLDGDYEDTEFGNLLIGNILNFGKQHDKLHEMYYWLKSKDAEKFLLNDKEYELAAKLILTQVEHLSQEDLDLFIEKYNKPLDFEIKLNEPFL